MITKKIWKFELRMSRHVFDGPEKELEKLGFKFEPPTRGDGKFIHYKWYCNGVAGSIEIGSLEELMNFIEKWGEILLNKDFIEIYNDYPE